MAINFPTSPTTDDIHTENNLSWKFNGTSWIALPTPSVAGNVAYTPAGTGAVATDVETKLRESVSVKDFGAVGDGVTDDTEAFILWLDGLNGSDGYVPEGTYLISSVTSLDYTLTEDIVIRMSNKAIIKGGTLAEPVITFRSASPYKGIEIHGGSIDNSTVGFSNATQTGTGIAFIQLENVRLTGVNIYSLDDYELSQSALVGDSGITTVNCRNVIIDGCIITGQPDCGIYLSGGATAGAYTDDGGQTTITNCVFVACDVGVSIKRELAGSIVTNNHFYKCRNGLVNNEVTGIKSGEKVVISSNSFKFTAQRCIEVRGGEGSIISGNVIEDYGYELDGITLSSSQYAVRLLGASNCVVSNNHISLKEWATSGGGFKGFNLNDTEFDAVNFPSQDNLITSNVILDADIGIDVSAGTSTANKFIHNIFLSVTTNITLNNTDALIVHAGDDFTSIGKTDRDIGVAGVSFQDTGLIESTRDGGTAASINRLTNYGDIQAWLQDGSKVALIKSDVNGDSLASVTQYNLKTKIAIATQNNTLFVDSADNLLKYKDNTGAVKTVNLT